MLEKRKITSRQRKYLDTLLDEHFKENKRLYLRLFHKINSLRELSLEQASKMIDRFAPGNVEADLNVSEALEKIYEHTGKKE